MLEDALKNRQRLEIEYISSQDGDGLGFKKTRLIDVYAMRGEEVEAYCHLRKSVLNFRISRIAKLEITQETYRAPQDAQPALF